jgi:hypothetical protein
MGAASHTTVEQLRRYDPHLTPDDRWRSAVAIVAEGRRASARSEPPEVAEAVAFLQAREQAKDDQGRDAVRERWPDLAAALRLYEAESPRPWEVQAWLLAGLDDAAVAARCGLTSGAVRRYEALFFAVRGRLGSPGWVLTHALRPRGPAVAFRDLGEVWRTLGYHGGPVVLDVVVAATTGRPLPYWVAERERAGDEGFGERLRLRARMVAEAMLLPADTDPVALARLYAEVRAFSPSRGMRSPVASVAERAAGALAAMDVSGARVAAGTGVTVVA